MFNKICIFFLYSYNVGAILVYMKKVIDEIQPMNNGSSMVQIIQKMF